MAEGAVWAVIVAGEYRDRANDAGVPVLGERPGQRDSDDQQCDQPALAGRGSAAQSFSRQPQ